MIFLIEISDSRLSWKLQFTSQRGHWVSGRRPGNCLSGLGRLGAAASRYSLAAPASRKWPVYLAIYAAAALRRPWLRVLSGLRIDAQWPALTPLGALGITGFRFKWIEYLNSSIFIHQSKRSSFLSGVEKSNFGVVKPDTRLTYWY